MNLDALDRAILAVVQSDGRLSNAEIAGRIGLSAPACWKRLKRLEEGVIAGYHARLDHRALGLNLFAFVSVMLDDHSRLAMEQFEAAVIDRSDVVACHNMAGRYDYLLQIVVADMDSFHDVVMGRIRAIGHVKEINTGFSIREIKRSTNLPL